MKKKRCSVEQITSVLQQVAAGAAVGDVCCQVGISEQTFGCWKKVYGTMLPSEARELKQLREEARCHLGPRDPIDREGDDAEGA